MFLDDELTREKHPQPFPRKLDGMAVEHMHAYIGELQAEIAKVEAEIAKRPGVRAKAESLFKS
jgi:uncharacterized small protein (DUF1192 family)